MARSRDKPVYVSVDVETSGPIPGRFSLLSIGACVAAKPSVTFYREVRPIGRHFDPKALKTIGRSMAEFRKTGQSPKRVMSAFARWIQSECRGGVPVFVGLNAPFDWSFVNWYFHTYTKRNPFGFAALDIKSLYMGRAGHSWLETSSNDIARRYNVRVEHAHNALADAVEQAALFMLIKRDRSPRFRSTTTRKKL